MADVEYKTMESKDYTTVTFDTAYALTDELGKTKSEFAGSIQKAASFPTFVTLKQLDLCGSFPEKFDEAMDKLVNSIGATVSSTNSYFDDLAKTDENIAGLIPHQEEGTENSTKPKGGNNWHPPTGGGDDPPSGGDPPGDENETEAKTETKTEATTEAGTELPDNSEEQVKAFSTMSMSDMSEVLATLNTLATKNGKTIDQLLSDPGYRDKIRDALLSNVNISTDLKKLIESGSSEAVVIALKKLVSGEITSAVGIDQDTTEVIKKYLENIATTNNTTLDKLVTESSYSDVVKKSLVAMKKVTDTTSKFTQANVQTKILDIYDGANVEIDDLSMDIIRSQVDVISELTEISYNEFLTEEAYSEEILKAMNRLTRTALFAETLSNCSTDAINKVLGSIVK